MEDSFIFELPSNAVSANIMNMEYLNRKFLSNKTRNQAIPYDVMCVAVPAILLDLLSLLAILRLRFSLSPNIKLVFSLILGDLLTSLFILCDRLYEVFLVNSNIQWHQHCWSMLLYCLKQTAYNSVLLTLLVLAVDLYIALLDPLHYTQRMSNKRICWIIIISWICSILTGFMNVYLPLSRLSHQPIHPELSTIYNPPEFCEQRLQAQSHIPGYLIVTLVLLSCLIMAVLYLRIFLHIQNFYRKRGSYTSSSSSSTSSSSPHLTVTQRRAARSLVTTLVILASFLLCYAPYYVNSFRIVIYHSTVKEGDLDQLMTPKDISYNSHWLEILVLLNSAFDPILYAIRMRDIRVACLHLYCFTKNSIGCKKSRSRKPSILSKFSPSQDNGSRCQHHISSIQTSSTLSWSSRYVYNQRSTSTTASNIYRSLSHLSVSTVNAASC